MTPYLRGRYARIGHWLTMPRPDDAPTAHAPGMDPDRILIFGNGPAVGWGVRSHELALPGHLARRLAALTHRGATVDVVADPLMTLDGAVADLPEPRLARYDAIIVVIGVSDALQVTSPRKFRRQMTALVQRLAEKRHRGATIVVLAIHQPSSMPALVSGRHRVVDAHARLLNEITREICASVEGVRFVVPPATPSTPDGVNSRSAVAPELFHQLAGELAGELAPLLDLQAGLGRDYAPERNLPHTPDERLQAVRRLAILDTPPEKRFDDIVERARILLATTGAAFSIIDEDRVWNKAVTNPAAVETPLRGAICAVTIASGDPFIVPDVWKDPRFVTHPAVRFYAGYPVESPDGIRIGALCVTDPNPRPADSVDLVLLRELALAVQKELALGPAAA